jgi:Holliday junction resolvase RusA-like endonuclease
VIAFEVPGIPVAKGRPRMTRRGHVYTPQTTIDFENRVRLSAQAAGVTPLEGPVELLIYAWWPMPKSRHRKREPRRAEMKDTGPEDWDNVGKAVSDALNGIAYADDAQVVHGCVWKYRAAQGSPAKTYVEIRSLAGEGADSCSV